MTGAWDSSSRFCKDRHVLHKVIHQDYDGYSPRKIGVAEGGRHSISKEIPEEADAKVHERSSALVGKMFIAICIALAANWVFLTGYTGVCSRQTHRTNNTWH